VAQGLLALWLQLPPPQLWVVSEAAEQLLVPQADVGYEQVICEAALPATPAQLPLHTGSVTELVQAVRAP
jgi:hypothetical protein